ncbi:MAG: hypothetical protein ABJB66_06095 [Gemmatimonadaceae bacterium]
MRRTVAVALAMFVALPMVATAQFSASSYSATKVFLNGVQNQHPAGIAWDGTSYWSGDGGGATGNRLAQYNAAGATLNVYAPGLDFRSVFTDAAGNVYGRSFSDAGIYKMTAPGTFSLFTTLVGGTLDAQSSVVLNGAGTGYLAMSGGVVQRWNLAGSFLGTTTLAGFGTLGTESIYPQNRGIASFGASWLTYDEGTLSMWSTSGVRLGTTTLTGAGTGFDANFSFSRAADGRVFIADALNGNWRGYEVGGGSVVTTPEPGSAVLVAAGILGLLVATRNRKRRVT